MILYYPPIKKHFNIPVGNHYGSFGVKRKFSYHCGVDLYTEENTPVFAIESGIVVEIKWFTGPDAGSDWWLPTRCVSIEGDSGVIVYGEIQEVSHIKIGSSVCMGKHIGNVQRVLKHDKGKPLSMLHIQLLEHGITDSDIPSWKHDMDKPKGLLNPTDMLIQCRLTVISHDTII